MGSSPLARGLPVRHGEKHNPRRIIPARAGFTRVSGGRLKHVHGSSPLARGLLLAIIHITDMLRIIPARAGFTIMKLLMKPPIKDHPRSRGVYRRIPTQRVSQRGSSPLARGLPRARSRA